MSILFCFLSFSVTTVLKKDLNKWAYERVSPIFMLFTDESNCEYDQNLCKDINLFCFMKRFWYDILLRVLEEKLFL